MTIKKKDRYKNKRVSVLLAAMAVLIFGAAGYNLIQQSRAAGSVASAEAESGMVAGAAVVINDANASAGKAVKFGQGGGGIQSMYLGAAIEPGQLDNAAFVNALKKYKFTSLTAENAMKFGPLEGSQGQFNWGGADKIVNFAQANNMRVRGHTLVWHVEVPGWVNGLNSQQASAALENHIKTVVGRYKGKIAQWDVVNEAFEDSGTLRNSTWRQKLGDGYIAQAFKWAREADPNVQLYYNDYSMESLDNAAKANAVYNLVKDFKAQGVPIDGVGFQTHADMYYPGSGPNIQQNIERFKGLGVKVEITELDVRAPDEQQRAQRYGAIGSACKNSGNCSGVTTWGLYDGHTWLGDAKPLMLDGNFNAKPAYTSLTQALGL